MKMYAQFFYKNNSKFNKDTNKIEPCEPYFVEALGSDGIMQLDARYSIPFLRSDCLKRMRMMRENLGKNYEGYKIFKGDLRHSRQIYSSF